jgi:hypothetical protein
MRLVGRGAIAGPSPETVGVASLTCMAKVAATSCTVTNCFSLGSASRNGANSRAPVRTAHLTACRSEVATTMKAEIASSVPQK